MTLHADHEHVRGLDVDPIEQDRAHDRQGIDAGHRDLSLYAQPGPRLHQLGVGDGAQQHLVVAPPLGLAPLRQDMSVGRAAEEPRELALQHRAPIGAVEMGDGLVAVFFFHHIDQHIKWALVGLAQVTVEQAEPGIVGVEGEGIGDPAALPVVDRHRLGRDAGGAPPAVVNT